MAFVIQVTRSVVGNCHVFPEQRTLHNDVSTNIYATDCHALSGKERCAPNEKIKRRWACCDIIQSTSFSLLSLLRRSDLVRRNFRCHTLLGHPKLPRCPLTLILDPPFFPKVFQQVFVALGRRGDVLPRSRLRLVNLRRNPENLHEKSAKTPTGVTGV